MIPIVPCLVLILLAWPALAAEQTATPSGPSTLKVPAPLRPWIPWVLYGHDDWTCPRRYDAPDQRYCAWPGTLHLELDPTGGRFSQTWTLYAPAWVPLPGGTGTWPERLRIDGTPATVLDRAGHPEVHLAEGEHRLEGRWTWPGLPPALPVPRAIGLVSLSLAGEEVAFPRREANGALWLKGDKAQQPALDRFRLEVFRRLQDTNPTRLDTLLRLEVSGQPRERLLGPVLPAGFRALALEGDLPARLEKDGRLRLQLRPGRWQVQITALHPDPLTALSRPVAPAPWPEREVWAFQADRRIRLVAVHGGTPVEPQHTRLPAAWRNLPAYALKAGQRLELHVLRRGDPVPLPDRIQVHRRLWLDFTGRGYTFSDQVSGTLSASWRLDMAPPWQPGRVAVDGQDQVITSPGEGLRGVELRRGTLNLTADGRIPDRSGPLSATGWAHEVQALSTELHLPPGWRLLHLAGADRVDTTWLQRWSLWDLFLVLLIALAMGRLWSWPWGLAALAVGLAIYQEAGAGAPVAAWLNLLAAIALLRVAPAGRITSLLRIYRHLSLAGLAILGLAFAIAQVRIALYPQLAATSSIPPLSPPPAVSDITMAPPALAERKKVLSQRLERVMPALEWADLGVSRAVDPKARITTGPGLPQWTGTRVLLAWNGPVAPAQTLDLWLSPPWATRLWILFGVAGLGALLWPLARDPRRPTAKAATLGVALIALGLPFLARAEIPSPDLLATLEERLLAPPDCAPACASYGTLSLHPADDLLQVELEVDAAVPSTIPLPGDDRHWRVLGLSEGDRPLPLAHLEQGARLWTRIPAGHHRLRLRIRIPADADTLSISSVLAPKRVVLEGDGWVLEGVDPRGVPRGQIQLRRRNPTPQTVPSGQTPSLPPFFFVEREIRLGLEWNVHTRVRRDPANQAGAVLAIPLLPGEAVTTPGIRVEDGRVRIAFAPGQQERHWDATLARRPRLHLQAPREVPWAEVWRIEAAPLWHLDSTGIPVVQRQDPRGIWRPEWRPWPGESLELAISRPPGVQGATLTIDHSRLSLTPGRRGSDAALEIRLRSSQGGQHPLRLPPGASLQRLSIDGRLQPVRQQGRRLNLPLSPGQHRVDILWHQAEGIASRFRPPRANLGLASVNAEVWVQLPRDRWLLWTRGPLEGPAVLYWGILVALFAAALVLGRSRLTPLRTPQWLLLGIGLSQIPPAGMVLVAAWLFALGLRGRRELSQVRAANLAQAGLAILTLAALATLAYGIQRGLLGPPEMQVAGNGSSAYELRWYADRIGPSTPAVEVISAPLWIYRAAMLIWALWLANALLGWLRWGWGAFARGGAWIPWQLQILPAHKKAADLRQRDQSGEARPPR